MSVDARADDVALFLAASTARWRGRRSAASRARSASSSRDSRWFSSAARACSAFMPLDHADEQLQLLLEPIDRFELDAAGRCFGHSHRAHREFASRYRCTAPCCCDERGQNRLERCAALRRRSACDRRLERQPDRQADRPSRNALALIAIEEARPRRAAPARRVAGRLNGATNDFRRQGVGDDDRQIAHDRRIARQRRAPRRSASPRARASTIEVQLGDEHAVLARQRRARRRSPARAGRRRRSPVRRPAGDDDRGRLPGDEERLRAPVRTAPARRARRTAARRRP